MPVPATSDLKSVSLVLTQDQIQRIRARKEQRSSHIHRVSLSDVYREVIEAGLEAISRAPNSSFDTRLDIQEQAA